LAEKNSFFASSTVCVVVFFFCFDQAEAAAAAAAAAYHNLPLLHHLHQQNPHFFAAGHQLGSLSALGAAGAGQFAGAGAFRPLTPSEAAFAGLGPANAHGLGAAPPPTTKGTTR